MLTEALARNALFPATGVGGASAAAPVGDDHSQEAEVAGAVLRALATMARVSKRQQAELHAALERAGLVSLSERQRQSALRYLGDTAAIAEIIPLDDGGVLISVTSAGMERALR